MVLNGDLTIASDLDVFERVGRGVAHDEYIEFEVKAGKILFEGDETELTRGKMRAEFIKVRCFCLYRCFELLIQILLSRAIFQRIRLVARLIRWDIGSLYNTHHDPPSCD